MKKIRYILIILLIIVISIPIFLITKDVMIGKKKLEESLIKENVNLSNQEKEQIQSDIKDKKQITSQNKDITLDNYKEYTNDLKNKFINYLNEANKIKGYDIESQIKRLQYRAGVYSNPNTWEAAITPVKNLFYPIEKTLLKENKVNPDITSANTWDSIGFIYFPTTDIRIGIEEGAPGDQTSQMASGASHEPASDMFGAGKNSHIVIAGHREYAFDSLYHIEPGTPILVGSNGNVYLYEVAEVLVTDENGYKDGENKIMDVSDNLKDEEILTLYTCYPDTPYGSITGRQVINAKAVKQLTY